MLSRECNLSVIYTVKWLHETGFQSTEQCWRLEPAVMWVMCWCRGSSTAGVVKSPRSSNHTEEKVHLPGVTFYFLPSARLQNLIGGSLGKELGKCTLQSPLPRITDQRVEEWACSREAYTLLVSYYRKTTTNH